MAPPERRCFLFIVCSAVFSGFLLANFLISMSTTGITSRRAVWPLSFLISEKRAIFISLDVENSEQNNLITSQKTSPSSPSDVDPELERRFEARRQRVKSTCLRRHGFFQSPNNNNNNQRHVSIDRFKHSNPFRFIFLDERNKILYCSVPKVASTTWRRFFVQLGTGNKDADEEVDFDEWNATWPYLKPLSYFYANENYSTVWNRIETYRKIMWVRDPFKRLLSAWRSKFQVKNDFYWQRIGLAIANRFPDLVGENVKNAGGPIPLEAFFRFLRNANTIPDIHWSVYHKLCLPCHISYDYIGKLEDGEVEANYVIRRVTHQDKILLAKQNTSKSMDKLKQEAVLQTTTLPRQLLNDVSLVYAVDFEMFDYPRPK